MRNKKLISVFILLIISIMLLYLLPTLTTKNPAILASMPYIIFPESEQSEGTQVILKGTDLNHISEVYINGKSINEINNINSDEIRFFLPKEYYQNEKTLNIEVENAINKKSNKVQIEVVSDSSLEQGINILPKYNQFLTMGEDNNISRILKLNGISYGPYIDLDKGVYTVKISGENLDNSNYDISYNLGKNKIDAQELKRDNKEIIFRCDLEENLNGIEFRVMNIGQKDVQLNEILISK
ncbi:IPT/TIG domain-containing protein [Clostridium beijerinckii]|uniref:IPT/TIG domain-containing protein n=1 Tax=Clostridium beijerinckii TaxID=1520 RepID=UPI001360F0D0|nr:IPT/TIG domain-containing protein [Clostridium beijerinckii]MZK52794.1 hypothetical protein [Clostridium beijerinckii]MZK60895.1 hypothetical protein [Clostridium beijerinckii]MZK71101.1 hypothetical protein [Clostridium beijerinckii]MZK76459.1 hypothetical protein [Clostridium beijerinckii]MZK85952.1 hypothetical protein [Clostridium beijerinckii]